MTKGNRTILWDRNLSRSFSASDSLISQRVKMSSSGVPNGDRRCKPSGTLGLITGWESPSNEPAPSGGVDLVDLISCDAGFALSDNCARIASNCCCIQSSRSLLVGNDL